LEKQDVARLRRDLTARICALSSFEKRSVSSFVVTREYKLKRRAERQDETRQRIVESAIALHQTIGPAATTVSRIAEQAGVGRVTVYRHFPDELALARACSGQYFTWNPPPDPVTWRAIADPTERLRAGLRETYAYHRATEAMFTHVLADARDHPVMEPYHDHWRRAADVLVQPWPARGRRRRMLRAGIALALAFDTWRKLAREEGLTDDHAVELMMRLTCAG
jgi:AcrR family transcriptional regulator